MNSLVFNKLFSLFFFVLFFLIVFDDTNSVNNKSKSIITGSTGPSNFHSDDDDKFNTLLKNDHGSIYGRRNARFDLLPYYYAVRAAETETTPTMNKNNYDSDEGSYEYDYDYYDTNDDDSYPSKKDNDHIRSIGNSNNDHHRYFDVHHPMMNGDTSDNRYSEQNNQLSYNSEDNTENSYDYGRYTNGDRHRRSSQTRQQSPTSRQQQEPTVQFHTVKFRLRVSIRNPSVLIHTSPSCQHTFTQIELFNLVRFTFFPICST